MNNKIEIVRNYYTKVKSANQESPKKEAFKDLLNRLYFGDKKIETIIDKISLGAETTVINIPRKDKLHIGSADTLYNNIIIEFKNDLKRNYQEAKEQLGSYLLGQLKSGQGYNFTLIASDCINWKVVYPNVDCLSNIENLYDYQLILNEIESASFSLTENNMEEFYYWIDRFLFKEEKQKATLKRIEESFGYQSHVFIESYRELTKWFDESKKYGFIQVSYEQWHKLLSIAYGSFEARENIFLIHTYLSIFSKMLAYSVISNDEYIDDNELRKILDGKIFFSYNITNFVDNDFFHWVNSDQDFHNLKKVFRLIAQEISSFDFSNVDEDILKGVYQELIDLDTRHSLGEYYTPDWLCERIVDEFEFTKTDKILDPACGSGSFLRAVIHRIKKQNPSVSVEEINQQIFGIDIHPLSVQIAKTTLLLALGKEIINAKKPVHLNIILANTLLAPEGVRSLFGDEFLMYIDSETYTINTQILDNIDVFDFVLDICEELSIQTVNQKKISKSIFENIVTQQFPKGGFTPQLINSFYKIYEGFKQVKEKGRDSIWKFIISNLYKPYFLSKKFDYVIGNPPWFTYSSIKNEDYQIILDRLAIKYYVKPKKVANYPHLEIAAIFQSHCSSYFLKDSGKMAFVLPRSFFSADHHDNTRSGIAKGFRLINIWDLMNVTPIFRIPSCVFFSEKAYAARKIKSSGCSGKQFIGKLSEHNCHYSLAKNRLIENDVTFYFAKLGKSTAFSTRKSLSQKKSNPYKDKFKQGATIVPRALYFVELNQEMPDNFANRIINIKTANSIKVDAKKPWNEIELYGRIESKYLFRTVLSRSILPFVLFKPDFIVLPIEIKINDINQKIITLNTSIDLRNKGDLNASKWFANAEQIWETNKTEKSKNMSNLDRLDFQRGLSEQNLNSNYLILYNSSAKDANALVIKRSELDLELIAESVSYILYTNNLKEAYYVTAILNSSAPNELIKDFQSRGLFGARHVHKKILDVYFPSFSENNELHNELAFLGKTCHEKAKVFLNSNPSGIDLTSYNLGKMRLGIKNHLSSELNVINKIVKNIIK